MLRAFFVLLSLITDYDTVSSLCHQALTMGLANSCILSLVGFLFFLSRVRHTVKTADKMHVTALRSGSSLPHLTGKKEGIHGTVRAGNTFSVRSDSKSGAEFLKVGRGKDEEKSVD